MSLRGKVDINVKQEKCEGRPEEKDMTHYIKDRVELIRQVFSVLRERELLAMAPPSLRSLPVDQLQELCLDEVLGISSKRLCSILDGYECPTDTDSDCPDTVNVETLSLDSISSLEDIETTSSKRKKRNRHHKKHKRRVSGGGEGDGSTLLASARRKRKEDNQEDLGQAGGVGGGSAAGMTVLELLELQMRAKAIRAQLQSVQQEVSDNEVENEREKRLKSNNMEDTEDDEDDVEIKEVKPEIVEIITSSEEEEQEGEAATVNRNCQGVGRTKENMGESTANASMANSKDVRKVKLNRNRMMATVGGEGKATEGREKEATLQPLPSNDLRNLIKKKKQSEGNKETHSGRQYRGRATSGGEGGEGPSETCNEVTNNNSPNLKKKNKKKKKLDIVGQKQTNKECEEDEILLQLSDTDKIFDSESSSSRGGSESEVEEAETNLSGAANGDTCMVPDDISAQETECLLNNGKGTATDGGEEQTCNQIEKERGGQGVREGEEKSECQCEETRKTNDNNSVSPSGETLSQGGTCPSTCNNKESIMRESSRGGEEGEMKNSKKSITEETPSKTGHNSGKDSHLKENLSEGECSDSSQDEDIKCRALEEDTATSRPADGSNQVREETKYIVNQVADGLDEPDNNDYVVFEISDESSRDSDLCVLSKEPSREEILELSKRLEKEMEMELGQEENKDGKNTLSCDESQTWKRRWLESDKVRNVLRTSSLLNALRKKNMELRKNLKIKEPLQASGDEDNKVTEDEKGEECGVIIGEEISNKRDLQAGEELCSVDYYKSLPSGSREFSSYSEEEEMKKMAKDAKQLMKMYKKLLKMDKADRQLVGQKEKKKKKKDSKSKTKKSKEKDSPQR